MSEDHIAQQLSDAFGADKTVYDILEVPKDATVEQIKKAYRKLALKHHPDKGGDENKFKALSLAHSILADEDKRKLYDQTGDVDADEVSQEFDFWYDYFRDMFPGLTAKKIDAFSSKYKGSEEESQDVINAYIKYKGNMKKIMECVMLVEEGDEGRICGIIDIAIAGEQIDMLSAYAKVRDQLISKSGNQTKKRKSKTRDDESDLASLILNKNKGSSKSSTSSTMGRIMSKYGVEKNDLMDGGDDYDIDDEAFMATQAKVVAKAASKKNKRK